MNFIGIDIGSTFLKAAVLSTESRTPLYHNSFPAHKRQSNPNHNIFQLPARQLLATVRNIIEEAAVMWPLDGILFSTQMHGFVYQTPDMEDMYISWQDSRCVDTMPGSDRSALEQLREIFTPDELQSCGIGLKPSLGLCNLYALLHGQNPPRSDGELFTLGSYLIQGLGGSNICHLTNAGPLGLADVLNHCWSQKVLQKAGLENIRLPRIAESDFEICGYCEAGGKRIALYPDYGDQQVCILGSMAQPRDVVINIATASQVSYNTTEFRPGSYEIRPYFENTYINTISNMPGGRNLAVLTDFLQETVKILCRVELSTSQVWAAVQKNYAPQSGLSVDTLFYPTGEKIDGGSIRGIQPGGFTLNALFTAAYEDMASTYATHIPLVVGKGQPSRLMFSGGVSWKNEILLQTVSRITDLPYAKSIIPDEAFSGLYRLALAAAGRINHLKDAPYNTLLFDDQQKE